MAKRPMILLKIWILNLQDKLAPPDKSFKLKLVRITSFWVLTGYNQSLYLKKCSFEKNSYPNF